MDGSSDQFRVNAKKREKGSTTGTSAQTWGEQEQVAGLTTGKAGKKDKRKMGAYHRRVKPVFLKEAEHCGGAKQGGKNWRQKFARMSQHDRC